LCRLLHSSVNVQSCNFSVPFSAHVRSLVIKLNEQNESVFGGSASYVSGERGTARICCCGPVLLRRRPCGNRSIFPIRRTHSSKPAVRCCSGRMGQTDRQTDGHRTVTQTLLCNYAGSANNKTNHYAGGASVMQRSGVRPCIRQSVCLFPNFKYKKLSYRRGTARCVVSIEILPIATQQCRNCLYDKS